MIDATRLKISGLGKCCDHIDAAMDEIDSNVDNTIEWSDFTQKLFSLLYDAKMEASERLNEVTQKGE